MKTDQVQSFFDSVRDAIAGGDGYAEPKRIDLQGIATRIGNKVENWLVENDYCAPRSNEGEAASCEALTINFHRQQGVGEAAGVGARELVELLRECDVADDMLETAAQQCGAILLRCASANSNAKIWGGQTARGSSSSIRGERVSVESLFPRSITSALANAVPSNETFGVSLDTVTPDLKMALTVTLLRYHAAIMPRVMPVRTTSVAAVQYIKNTMEVIDTNDITVKKRLVDLYTDPSLVNANLKRIVPLADNDDAADVIVDGVDGLLRFGKVANIVKLSLDADTPGYDSADYTDIISPNARLESVQVALKQDATTETFEFTLPGERGFLAPSFSPDSHHADARAADIIYSGRLVAGSTMTNNVASTLLAVAGADDVLLLSMIIKPSLNLETAEANCLFSASASAINTAGNAVAEDLTTLVTALNADGGITGVGYVLDARFSEENKRKSSIAIRSHRKPYGVEIPTGRNYIYDFSLEDSNGGEDNAAHLTRIMRIGQDDRGIDMIATNLTSVAAQTGENALPGETLCDSFVAGDIVKPIVIETTLDCADITSVKHFERASDIKGFVDLFFTELTEDLFAASFYDKEIVNGGRPRFRVITSNPILGMLLGQKSVAERQNQGDTEDQQNDGVEYTLKLSNGTILEVVTCTFSKMSNQIYILPYVQGSPESPLNYGHDWDFGMMIGNYSIGSDGARNRLFANSRELPFITCPVGGKVTVTNLALLKSVNAGA